MKRLLGISNIIILFLFAGMICFPFLGEVHLFDWEETLIASVSKEMFFHNEVLEPLLNGTYYLEKLPFFFWCQLISFKYLGINEYAARFPNAVCLLFVVLTLYRNGKRIYSANFGMMWALIYLSIILAQFYHKSGLVEPWFHFFIYLAIYNFTRILEMRQEQHESYYKRGDIAYSRFYAAFATSGAILTNGVEGFFVIILSYWLVFLFSSARYGIGVVNFVKYIFWVLIVVGVWVVVEYKWHGTNYLEAFYHYQLADIDITKASLTRKMAIPILVLLLGCFPASAICFNSLRPKTYESTIQKIFRLFMICSLFLVLIIVTFVKDKLVHFTSFTYFPISFLAAYSLRYIFEEGVRIKASTWFLMISIGAVWASLLIAIPASRANIGFFGNFIPMETLQSVLKLTYPWQEYEQFIGYGFLLLFIIALGLMIAGRARYGFIVLFFSAMLISQIVLIYYTPKLEQLSQGAQVDFVLQRRDEPSQFIYHNGRSYLPNFYSNYPYRSDTSLRIETAKSSKETPIYLIKKTDDTTQGYLLSKKCRHLYNHGIYSFYKVK